MAVLPAESVFSATIVWAARVYRVSGLTGVGVLKKQELSNSAKRHKVTKIRVVFFVIIFLSSPQSARDDVAIIL